MELYYVKIIETLVVITLYILLRRVVFNIVSKTLLRKLIHKSRGIVIRKVLNLLLATICGIFILVIWGVKQSDLLVFLGSILAVVGVAFFAQWSLLSNITSSIIIFFNHPVKLNDSIIILEGKDYVLEGVVVNIGLFFVTLRTTDLSEITLPNNIFIQKSIKNITQNFNEN
ncbi:mechanosensitive ion channel-like protein [Winogradskyella wandonensis]|uniref:Mechanosensitive ion channel-like protein n=1 Tax=Winogradskyella wandonensis TaxID=1442586 RepID=A0A4R1KV26_9FLAO|nr:mechanosensitive ion channel domain-containing protein [Winogradskyella wandonensis]TCK69036.1 mechanosensitive ion channel-like protein [Winogradskyella wandonensis]